MPDLMTVWREALPEIRNSVTGRAVWEALNNCRPITTEGEVVIIGLDHKDRNLMGHLTAAATKRAIEQELGSRMGKKFSLRVIDGVTDADWQRQKLRDNEANRLRDEQRAKMRAEAEARSNWDTVYEQLSRSFAAVPNKALAQNRAKFFEDALQVLAQNRKEITDRDDLAERNFARCIERVAQYSEVATTIVAHLVLQRVGEI